MSVVMGDARTISPVDVMSESGGIAVVDRGQMCPTSEMLDVQNGSRIIGNMTAGSLDAEQVTGYGNCIEAANSHRHLVKYFAFQSTIMFSSFGDSFSDSSTM